MNKKEKLRLSFLEKRKQISEDMKRLHRKMALKHLQAYLEDRKHINTILSYVNYKSEAPTDAIHRWILEKQFCLGLPKMHQERIYFYQIHDLDHQLEKTNSPMLEPNPDRCLLMRSIHTRHCLVLTPGLAFDVYGGRLGSGRGFYDRFFAKNPQLNKIGFAYSQQRTLILPTQKHDILLDGLITEKKLYIM